MFIKGPAGQLEVMASLESEQPLTVLVFHPHPLYGGTMDNKVVQIAFKTCLNLGFKAVKFNFRGVGKSEGQFDHGVGEVEDALAVLNWIKSEHPHDRIALVGFSFGSYIATEVANKGEFAFLVAIAPAVKHFEFGKEGLPTCPWIIIQGDADEIVSPEAVFNWAKTLPANAKLIRMKGVGHFFHKKLIDLQTILTEEIKAIV